jgi:hypothetical protein
MLWKVEKGKFDRAVHGIEQLLVTVFEGVFRFHYHISVGTNENVNLIGWGKQEHLGNL